MMRLRESLGRPWIIGHRGASVEAPENTMAAFRLALEQGADMVETDVQLSADGVPVLLHDATLERTTNGRGFVKDHSLAEIRTLDAGSWFDPRYAGETVPTLEELLQWAAGETPVCLEIKNGPVYYPGIEDKVVEALRRHSMVERAVIISFDHHAVLRVKGLCPECICGVLYACRPVEPAALALAAGAEMILPHWGYLDSDTVEEVHRRGLFVSAWTADREQEMRWLVSLGVDGIATNYPGRLASLLKRG